MYYKWDYIFSKKLTVIISRANFPWHIEKKGICDDTTCSVQNLILLCPTKLCYCGKEVYFGIDKGDSSSWLLYGRNDSTIEI